MDTLWRLFQVSNFGRVKSFYRGKKLILKPSLHEKGYLRVVLYTNGKNKIFRIHRLVAQLFIPNPENKPEINHVDGNKLNNFAENLEWVTHAENMGHAAAVGLNKTGAQHPLAKLTDEQVKSIRNNPSGLSIRQLAKLFGVDPTVISEVQCGKSYKKSGGSIRKSKNQPRVPDDLRATIRQEYKPRTTGRSCCALAKKYGVTPQTVWKIVHENNVEK